MTRAARPGDSASVSDPDVSFAALVHRARSLLTGGERAILGIAGPPGSGKSYLAERLITALLRFPPAQAEGTRWVCNVPMDGFHLADAELARLNRSERKGAPDTFDPRGFGALLRRLTQDRDQTVYAPGFDRVIEQPIAGSIAVEPAARLIITEGNYLLADGDAWRDVRRLLNEVWYCDADEGRRITQLALRHIQFGKSPDDARSWAECSDQVNAELVTASRHRADLIIPDSTLVNLTLDIDP